MVGRGYNLPDDVQRILDVCTAMNFLNPGFDNPGSLDSATLFPVSITTVGEISISG
jgi:hypothetical protein